MPNHLKIQPIRKRETLKFGFLEFQFFWNSPDGKAIVFGNPAWLAPLIAVPYMLAAVVYNIGGSKYFVKRGNAVAGLLVLKMWQDTLIVHTLAVSPAFRRHGVGLFILRQAENSAREMNLTWLELVVLKGNVAAQRLYANFGFKVHVERKLSFMLRKRLPHD